MTNVEMNNLHALHYRELRCKFIVDTLGFKLDLFITKLLMPSQRQTENLPECSSIKQISHKQ